MVDISKKIKRDKYIKDHKDTLIHEILITIIGILIDSLPLILISISITLLSLDIITYKTFLILQLFLIPLLIYYIYLIFIKFYRFKINTFNISSKFIDKNKTILFISDLHLGNGFFETNIFRLRRIIKLINNINYDLLIIGGDIFNFIPDTKLLNELKNTNGKKITVLGNHDFKHVNFGNLKNKYRNIFSEINNIVPIINHNGIYLSENIYISGINDMWEKDFDLNRAFKDSNSKKFNILISHNPDIIDHIELDSSIDLILSGHLHSGQINLINLSLPMPTRYQWLRRGMYQITARTKLLLSQGIGVSRSRLRINTDNEICVINLIKE